MEKKKYTEFMSMFGVVRYIVRSETVCREKFRHIASKFSRWGGNKNEMSGNRWSICRSERRMRCIL